MAEKIAAAVAEVGGRAYYVGGFVRDRLLGRECKDIDMEIHGVPVPALEAILDSLGSRIQMGASFGIYGLGGYDLDIALPRKEQANGRGHKDFAVFTDPFLGAKKAAMRRDFTVNALMEDVLTGQIVDFFHGREDLEKGILRHVDDASFPEDPLRVLRAAQFAARFGFAIAPETAALCKTIDLRPLSGERVLGELEKALLKAPRPSVFFEVLRQMDQLQSWFPEVQALIGVPQEPRFHPEGDVWNHTMLVLDRAAELRSQAANPRGLMFAALGHDFGKPATTCRDDTGRIRALGHEEAGLTPVRAFLNRITKGKQLSRYVLSMTRLHMRPNMLAAQHSGQKSFNRLFDESLCPEDLLLLSKADALGKDPAPDYSETEAQLQARLSAFRETMAQPYVQGADLVAAGFPPNKDFTQALTLAHSLRLAGVPKKKAMGQVTAFLRKARKAES